MCAPVTYIEIGVDDPEPGLIRIGGFTAPQLRLNAGQVIVPVGEHVPRDRRNRLVEQVRALLVGAPLVVSPGRVPFEGTARIRARRTSD